MSHLRQYHILIKAQAEELTQLWQKLREGREVSEPVDQHLKDLLTHDDPERSQGQGIQEQVAEGHRLAECLARQLSPGKAATGPVCTELLRGPGLPRHLPPPLTLLAAAVLVSM